MKTLTHNTAACVSIDDAAREIIEIAKQKNACITTDFNGHPLSATPSDNPNAVIERWDAASVRRQIAELQIKQLEGEIEKLKKETGQ